MKTLARISHTLSSRDAARSRPREARPGLPAGLYENIPSKGNPGRNDAGTGRSQSQRKGYGRCGLAKTLFLFGLSALLSLTSCVTVEEPGTGTPPPSGYALGKAKGYADGHGGLSRTPSRHGGSYSEADRADFFKGYEEGYNEGIKPGAPAPTVEEKPATGPVPQKVINDCIDALKKQIPDKDIMLLNATRGENSYIVDLLVRGAEKPWRCYHDGTRCTGTEYQGEG